MNHSKAMKKAVELFLVFLGNFMMSVGVGAFIIPSGLMVGGATGIGLIMSHYFQIPVSSFVGAYNAVMFVIGAIFLGKHFAFTTLISSFLFPCFLAWIEALVHAPLTSDPLLALILGGLLIGTGIGLVIRAGSSTGGNDIPTLLLNKKLGVPISVSMNLFDFAILALQLPYSHLETALYSIVLVLLYSTTADKMSAIGKGRMQVRIISKHYSEISDAIKKRVDRGVTLYHIQGGYSGEESCEVMTVLSPRELPELNRLVTEIDPTAFIMLARINEVRGRGFSIGKWEP